MVLASKPIKRIYLPQIGSFERVELPMIDKLKRRHTVSSLRNALQFAGTPSAVCAMLQFEPKCSLTNNQLPVLLPSKIVAHT